ncbi:hypothetical protein AGABI1DRAFT_125499 [Agaricus bisporus var. burnettii JB137-S8]|uniref:Uncharacterized protein n=1 Tax=Agaricus bisporus var. burnettii (strain JB137-S8 / ATCC MYA-4627 / FGSC 10392) TaxID=597362 RepID=K5XI67_AGABU|nr:uncharacterized protein AGABI1DRAFT_125499 [Agaricus bisporus var. burnettii JB137-S8]EKM83022.1 hypothetical protein AGABI1DRAFT_125499 [Agaricus bisporus var. burnettii JB137-S8]
MTSSNSQILESFDPFATHPFTNGSGLIPQPPKPSQYPIPIPSPRQSSSYSPCREGGSNPASASSTSSMTSGSPSSPPTAPQPRRHPASTSLPRFSTSSSHQPIFVPFRKETSSPDLVLRKKVPVSTAKSVGTQTPSTSRPT